MDSLDCESMILALTDALGNLVPLQLMPGNRYDSVDVPPMTDGGL